MGLLFIPNTSLASSLVSGSKTYTLSPAPGYSDSGYKLTNTTTGAAWNDGNWVGWEMANPSIVVDLETGYDLDYVRFHYNYSGPGPEIYAPNSLIVSGSNNNVDWTQIGSFVKTTDWNNAATGWSNNLNVSGSYRYIKFAFTYQTYWLFLSELEVYAPSYTLTYTAGANGSITGDSPQTVASGSDGTAVEAVPNANYYFVDWSDGSTQNPRTDKDVAGNISVTANFAIYESARRLPTAYTVHTYGTVGAGRTFQTLNDWEGLTDINLTSVTTTDQDSSGNTLYVADTTVFNDCELNESTVSVGGQILTITGVNAGVSLTVSDISGTISSGTAVQTGFVLRCYDDAAPYNDNTYVSGATTNSSYFRVITAAEGQRGTKTSGVRFEKTFAINNASIVTLAENYASLYDVGVKGITTDITASVIISGVILGADYNRVVGCTAYDMQADAVSTGRPTGIQTWDVPHGYIIDSVVTGSNGGASGATTSGMYLRNSTVISTIYVYNNTVVSNEKYGIGIVKGTANQIVYAKNNVAQGNTTSQIYNLNGTLHETTNATSGVVLDADGYHLDPTDTTARGNGTDLSADSVYSFNDDIDGNIRSAWDIGADEYVPSYTLTYTAGANGSVTGDSPQTLYEGEDGTAVEAIPDANYHFVNWSDASTENPRTDTNVTGNITVTANFAIDTYTLAYTAGANGSITGDSPQTVDYGSDGTAVEAVPNPNYHFVNWSDAATDNPRTDTNITGNVTVTANFAIDTHTLTYTAGANGSITGDSSQTVDYGSDGTAVEAVSDPGYHFVDWSDASTDNPRTDINVTGDVTVTANFALDNVAPSSPTSPLQYKADGTTAITNEGYTSETSVKLKASVIDADNPEIINLFFESALHDGSFNSPATPTTGTSCASATEWDSCASKIWYVTSGSGDYTVTPYIGTVSVAGLANDGYKWQVKACDDSGSCSAWVAYNATVPNFTVDSSTPDIVAVDAGASNVDRTSLTTDTWFKYSDTGSDDQISFSWTDPSSASDDTFYYELNSNSGDTITGDESATANSYIDDITVSEGTNYFHVRPRNGAGTWGTERKFTVEYDKTAPTGVAINSIVADSESQLTVNTAVGTDSGSGLNAEAYWFEETSGNPGGSSSSVWQSSATFIDDGLSPNTQYSYRVKARDALGNESSYSIASFKYTLANSPSNLDQIQKNRSEIIISWEANSNPSGTEYLMENVTKNRNSGWMTSLSWASDDLSCSKDYVFRIKSRNGDSVESASQQVTFSSKGCKDEDDDKKKKSSLVSIVVQSVRNYLGLNEEKSEEESEEVEVIVSDEVPLVFQGNWYLLPVENINHFALEKLPADFELAIGKFPKMKETLTDLGVEKVADLSKLGTTKFNVSSLKDAIGSSGDNLVNVSQLSSEEKEKIPTEIIFVRTAEGLVDLGTFLQLNKQGDLQQQFKVLAGKTLQLYFKPENAVRQLSGIIALQSGRGEQKNNFSSVQSSARSLLGETAIAQTENSSSDEKLLVLDKFEYDDSDEDGIYEAKITSPLSVGKYKIITNVEYKDVKIGSRDVEIVAIVDPEGYLYEKIKEGEMRVSEAEVSLFWFDLADGQYKLWPADKFMQSNPQITDKSGNYSFLVPEGKYYLSVSSVNYLPYKSEEFEVKVGEGIHKNIELKKEAERFLINWKYSVPCIILILAMTILAGVFYKYKMLKK